MQLFSGTPYDYVSVAPEGALVFTAGACPLDGDGRVVAIGDHEGQAQQALENLQAALAEVGSSFEQVLKTSVYVVAADLSELVRTWSVVDAAFAPSKPPSTLLGVVLLGYPDQLVEIEAIAVTRQDPFATTRT